MSQRVLDQAATVVELQRALHGVPHRPEPPGAFGVENAASSRSIVILGAQPNVGASSLAVALADALAQKDPGSAVRLLDLADRVHSGLICAADRELGAEDAGWQLARRRAITVERLVQGSDRPEGVVALRRVADSHAVIDVGQPLEELELSGGWLRDLLCTSQVVIACAATVPGARRAEAAIAAVPSRCLAVAVGVDRWPTPVLGSAGPLLRAAHSGGRLFVIPADKRLAVEGVDDQPMSKPVLAAAARILHALMQNTSVRPAKIKRGLIRWS